ncbi:MAG: LamG-like jellyroll fold domain-containing protein [Opitutales bacterium]
MSKMNFQLTKLPWLLVAVLSAGFAAVTVRSESVETVIRIGVEPGLKFDVSQFAVSPGGNVRLIFENTDTDMPHNLLITTPGARLEVVTAAMQMGAQGPAREYVPESDKVLHYTRVLQAGESETLTFRAPEEVGIYPYVCTFPGHGFVMYGDMHVTEDPASITEADAGADDAHAGSGAHHHDHAAVAGEYELQILRTFVRDTGPAAIAVRLPNGHAYCWDAGGARLRYLWKGGFVDNLAHWRGNGSSFGEIVGRIYYRAPIGEVDHGSPVRSEFGPNPLRIGEEISETPAIRFRGYRIVDGLPEFHYEIDGTEVREYIYPTGAGDGVAQRFRVKTDGEPIFFKTPVDAGVTFTSSAGEWTGNVLKIEADDTRDFTITMRGIPGQEPVGYWSMNDDLWNPGFMQSSLVNDSVRGRAVRFNENRVNTGIQSDEIRYHGTFATWVRPADTSATEQLIFQGRSGEGEFFGVGYNLGVEGFGVLNRGGGENVELHTGLPVSSQWQHVAVTFSTDEMALYVNGRKEESRPTEGLLMNNAPLYIGSANGAVAFQGDLDEVRVYQRVLSEAEIHALYESEKPEEESR